ncbi:MAG TPA: hypothetical protein VF268_02050 [Gammaproteobacteria bacterium]
MRILTPTRLLRVFVFSMAGALFAAACQADDHAAVFKAKLDAYHYFEPNLALPLPARVQTMPDESLQSIIAFDRSIGIANTDYKPRTATPADIALFAEYVALLPKHYQTVLSNKLMAVHFVDNFAGAGLTDWYVDQRGEVYYYMILNSALLTESLDDWLTYRENSYFTQAPESYRVRVRTGTEYKALLYGLLHEGGHIVDYEGNVSPYLDPVHKKKINAGETSDFTGGIWQSHKTPVDEYDFKNRDRLNVYGIFSDKPLVPAEELPGMFTQLARTPFVSFYAGTAWHEDFADLVTYYHVEKKLGGEVVVELLRDDRIVDSLLPAKRGLDGVRLKILKDLY